LYGNIPYLLIKPLADNILFMKYRTHPYKIQKEETEQTIQMAETFKSRLHECMEKDENGNLKMTITLPDESVLDNLAKSLAQVLGSV